MSTRLGITADIGANVINYQSLMNNATADTADLKMTSLFVGGPMLEYSDLILFWIQICFLVIKIYLVYRDTGSEAVVTCHNRHVCHNLVLTPKFCPAFPFN